jgi:hypothetical protein
VFNYQSSIINYQQVPSGIPVIGHWSLVIDDWRLFYAGTSVFRRLGALAPVDLRGAGLPC